VILILLLGLCGSIFATTPPAQFTGHVVGAGLTGGTQVVIADLNNDGKPDVIAVASGRKELIWFENPNWKPHVLAADLPGLSSLAVGDVDRDGIPEILVAHEYADDPKKSLGILSVLRHREDPRKPWKISEIDRIPTSHLLRWARVGADGQKALVNAPLSGPNAEPPDYGGNTSLVLYRPGAWMREVIPGEIEGAIRGVHVADWDGAGREDIFTAGSSGIHQFRLERDSESWTITELTKRESANVTAGSLGKRGEKTRFLASLEPSPVTQISIYKQDSKLGWRRQIIDEGLARGGALLAVDLNGDGNDEIVSSDAGQNRGINLYYSVGSKGEQWHKSVLDSGDFAASDCAAGDLNGDGLPDLVCISATSGLLKWYENKGLTKLH